MAFLRPSRYSLCPPAFEAGERGPRFLEQPEVVVALRAFVGDDGQDWEVWDTRPVTRSPGADVTGPRPGDASLHNAVNFSLVSAKREGGWLTFTTSHERRRLSPIPKGWETADDATLCALLARADRIAD